MNDPNPHLRSIDQDECWELLHTAVIGMVAFVDDDGQQLVPVNIHVIDRRLFFQINESTLLGRLAAGHDDVAVMASYADTVLAHGWNVTVRGSSRRIDDDQVRDAIEHSGRRLPWAGDDRTVMVEIVPRSVDGRSAQRH